MAMLNPARSATAPMHAPSVVAGEDTAEQLRDQLTIERLSSAVAELPDLKLLRFDSDWWDGQAHGPCLVISFGSSSNRRRVVETAGDAVVVPLSRRRAGRELAARRAPGRAELGIPPQRLALDDVVLDAVGDAVRCGSGHCGALRPIDSTQRCPVCGHPAPLGE
jgi:hypothetical protein